VPDKRGNRRSGVLGKDFSGNATNQALAVSATVWLPSSESDKEQKMGEAFLGIS
jgi:hypothetical protein